MAVETFSEIYNTAHYNWDKKDRPVLSNYTQPWSYVASQYQWQNPSGKNRKAANAAIAYAKNQLNTAISQYEADIDWWNEQDARAYNTPLAQSQRYENADFNLGYMYGNVESGNTSSGYSAPSSSFDLEDNQGQTDEVKAITDVIGGTISLISSLAKEGYSIAYLSSSTSYNKIATELNRELKFNEHLKGMLLGIDYGFKKFLASSNENGNINNGSSEPSDYYNEQTKQKSYMFQEYLETVAGLKLSNEESREFLKKAAEIYDAQASADDTGEKEMFEMIDNWDTNDKVKSFCKVLVYVFGNSNFFQKGGVNYGKRQTN